MAHSIMAKAAVSAVQGQDVMDEGQDAVHDAYQYRGHSRVCLILVGGLESPATTSSRM